MKIIRGNYITISIYTLFMLIVGISMEIVELVILALVNIISILVSYYMNKIKSQKSITKTIKNEELKLKAIKKIEKKYSNQKLSEEIKKDLIRDEYIKMLINEKEK